MEKKFIEKAYGAVEKKVKKVDTNFANYALRAMLAGALLALMYGFTTQVSFDFMSSGDPLGTPIGKLAMAFLFGLGLIFIVYLGAELFTSNAMYFGIGLGHKKVSFKKTLKVWVSCWVFNFIGTALIVGIIVLAGTFNAHDGHFPNEYIFQLAGKKANYPWHEILFKGMLANWVVNMTVFTALSAKDDIGKFFIISFGLTPFVYLGFDHSIANFGVFLYTWMIPGAQEFAETTYHFTTSGALHNLFWATLGNIIGGAVMVGGYLAFLHRDKINEQEVSE